MFNFWESLAKPFTVLAPMEDVTDSVFRRVVRYASCQINFENINLVNFLQDKDPQFISSFKYKNRPEVFFTEFTNVTGLQWERENLNLQDQVQNLDNQNLENFTKNFFVYGQISHRLFFLTSERPIVAQIWGITPEDYYQSAKIIQKLGFDGIDINMGCPVKKVIKMGACSALIKNRTLAKEVVQATKEGCNYSLPVSIKTRIGFKQIETESWVEFLLSECKPEVLTIHGRTVKEQSKVPCHWEEIVKAVKINKNIFQDENKYTKSLTKEQKLNLWKNFWIKKFANKKTNI